jgi:hypothetical protein
VERLLGIYSVPEKDDVVFTFRCEPISGAISISAEADDVRWFSRGGNWFWWRRLALSPDTNGSSWSIAEVRDVRADSFIRLVDGAGMLEESNSIANSRNRTHANWNLRDLLLGDPRKSTGVHGSPLVEAAGIELQSEERSKRK